jgi:uncharacterized cupredoxin-like copper-binding protein
LLIPTEKKAMLVRNSFLGLSMLVVGLAAASTTSAQQLKEIRITANEFSFKPSKIQAPQGEVKIVVTNRGKFPHSLAIVGREEKISYLDSGETKSLTIRFDKAGELVFYCSQPGHRGKGMEGKLTVK